MYLRKPGRSKLDPFAEELAAWFDKENLTGQEACDRLEKEHGLKVGHMTVLHWWQRHRLKNLQDELLRDIAESAKDCAEIEAAFAKNPAPAIKLLIKLNRLTALRLNKEGRMDPGLVRLMTVVMKPVLDWARLEEQRRAREHGVAEANGDLESKGLSERIQSIINQQLGIEPGAAAGGVGERGGDGSSPAPARGQADFGDEPSPPRS
jgi:hypothetical protein